MKLVLEDEHMYIKTMGHEQQAIMRLNTSPPFSPYTAGIRYRDLVVFIRVYYNNLKHVQDQTNFHIKTRVKERLRLNCFYKVD